LKSLILAFDESAGYIKSHDWPEIAARTMIEGYYSKKVADGKIPSDLTHGIGHAAFNPFERTEGGNGLGGRRGFEPATSTV